MLEKYYQDVVVKTRTQTGQDSYNHPTYSYTETNVSKVLVKPENGQDAEKTSTAIEGHIIKYALYFPKDCTLDLENAEIKVDNEWYRVVGDPKPYPAVPSRFNIHNRVVYVEKRHG